MKKRESSEIWNSLDGEKIYRTIAELTDDLIYLVGSDMKIKYLNTGAAGLLKAKPETMIGKNIFNLLTPADGESLMPLIKNVFLDGSPATSINCLNLRGKKVWLDSRVKPVKSDDGKVVAILGISRDITADVMSEEMLLMTQERLKAERDFSNTLIDSSIDGILAYDPDCRYTVWNPGMEKMSGVKKEDVLGRVAFDVFPFLKETGGDKYFYDALNGKASFGRNRIYYVPETNRNGFFESHHGPLRDQEGRIIGGLAIIRDVTEYKHAEDRLRDSEEHYRALAETSDDIIFVLDKKFNVTYLNETGCRMLNKEPGEILGGNIADLFNAEALRHMKTSLNKAIKSRRGLIAENVFNVNGRAIWLETKLNPIFNEKDKVVSIMGVSHDITPHVKEKTMSDAMNEINALINSTLDFEEIIRSVIPKTSEVLGTEFSWLFERSGNQWVLKYQHGNFSKSLVGSRLTDKELPNAALTARTKKPVAVENTSEGESVRRQAMEKLGIKSVLTMPLVLRGEVIGVIGFCNHSKTMSFTESQIDFSNKLAASLAMAIENARLFDKEQKNSAYLRESLGLNEALNEINTSINSVLDIDEIMSIVVKKAAEAMGCETSTIIIKTGDKWTTNYVYGEKMALVKGSTFLDDEVKAVSLATSARETIYCSDTQNDARFNMRHMRQFEIKSFIVTPLIARDKEVGALTFMYHSAPITFSENQIDFAKKLGVSISLAIENARLYQKKIVEADKLQKVLLDMPKSVPGVAFDHFFRSNSPVTGGVFYDLFEVGKKKVAVILGDVESVRRRPLPEIAALNGITKTLCFNEICPANAVRKTASMVKEITKSRITMFLAFLDKSTGDICYCNAGHNPAIIGKANSKPIFLEPNSPGINDGGGDYSFDWIKLEEKDTLVLFNQAINVILDNDLSAIKKRFSAALKNINGEIGGVAAQLFREITKKPVNSPSGNVSIIAVGLDKRAG